ncbi:MAG TPA: acetylxylan esterase [Gaiellaceae bacterium]|nr:acetylxylan esterase [Gaiellaceae bacterium]
MRRPVLLLALVALLAACGGDDEAAPTTTSSAATTTAPAAPSDPFAYDAAAPLRFRDLGRVNEGSRLEVRDVRFAGADGGDVQAYLVRPPGEGPYPAVVYLHGQGADRLQLVGMAAWLAARGAVALTLDSPFVAEQPQGTGMAALRSERDLAVRGILDARRAVDLLRSLPQVDDGRIGLVGFSAGARSGAVLAGVERRISAYVLWSGGSEPVAAYTSQLPAGLRAEAGRLLSDVDPLRWVARSRSELLFQTGREDEVVPRAALERLFSAAPEPKERRWYAAGHELDVQAYRDQLDWLTERLRIDGPRVPGADTGPPE